MRLRATFPIAVIGILLGAASVRADVVVVRLGNTLIPMEGKISDPKQPIITVTHEKFRKGADGKDLKLNLPYRRPGVTTRPITKPRSDSICWSVSTTRFSCSSRSKGACLSRLRSG